LHVEIPEALLDTDTLSLYGRGHAEVRASASAYLRIHGRFTFSELTRYEVTRGFRLVGAMSRLTAFERLCDLSRVLPFDAACTERAASIWVDLHQRGQLIGEVDILIAATGWRRN